MYPESSKSILSHICRLSLPNKWTKNNDRICFLDKWYLKHKLECIAGLKLQISKNI